METQRYRVCTVKIDMNKCMAGLTTNNYSAMLQVARSIRLAKRTHNILTEMEETALLPRFQFLGILSQ
jgi:hypothetical protein